MTTMRIKVYPDFPNEPKCRRVKNENALSQPAKTEESVVQSRFGGTYRTTVRLYMQQSGPERAWRGSTVEIQGRINFYNNSNSYYIETPENTNFSGEGGGLGRLVGEASIVTKGAPALFTGILWEEGGGDRYFAIATVDWNKDPEDWADGREWYFTQSLENFIGHVAWQVSPI
jgi:glucan phosphorylase